MCHIDLKYGRAREPVSIYPCENPGVRTSSADQTPGSDIVAMRSDPASSITRTWRFSPTTTVKKRGKEREQVPNLEQL